MSTAEQYVTAAYCVVFALVLVYVVIIALKLQRLEREVDALAPEKEFDREVAALTSEKSTAGADG
jgi:CcmD family protein